MPRPGHCPSCDNLFDPTQRTPMVSVVCGHSLCKPCATLPTPPAHSSDTDDTSASDDADRDAPCCPVCSVPLAGFVKNYEALAALETSTSTTTNNTNTPSQQQPPSHGEDDDHEDRQHAKLTTTATSFNEAPDLEAVVTGDLVIDRSHVHFIRSPSHELGKGASAVVYRGHYNNSAVAIKCIRTMSDSFTSEDRLRRELRNASRLKNPHIVEFRGAAWDHEDGPESPRNVLLITELMAGGNLRESLNLLSPDTGGLAIDSFVIVALQIARGIEYLHAEGLAHRDIKSANILLTERLSKHNNYNRFSSTVRAKIADFGLSKYIDRATGGGTVMQSIMEPGRLEATYGYLAPEAFGGDKTNVLRRRDDSDDDDNGNGNAQTSRNGAQYDETAKKRDIYALGVLFWEMLTGQIPWAGVSLPDVYVRVCVRSDRPAPALDDSVVDRTFHRLIDRCWAQNPQRRPSARSIVAKLEKLAVRYHVADPNASATEAVSVVSGANAGDKGGVTGSGSGQKQREEQQQQLQGQSQGQSGAEPLLAFHKMPSASTVHTTPNDDPKGQSMGGLETSEGALDRMVDDIPNQYDDDAWIADSHSNNNNIGTTNYNTAAAVGVVPTETTAVGLTSSLTRPTTPGGKTRPTREKERERELIPNAEPLEAASLNRRPTRPRPAIPVVEGIVSHSQTHSQPAPQQHLTHQQVNNSLTKSSATAVAATAAAIAAAKDRERRHYDQRHVRNTGATTAAARVAKGVNTGGPSGTGNNNGNVGATAVGSAAALAAGVVSAGGAGVGGTGVGLGGAGGLGGGVGETSLQSLTGGVDGWGRNTGKDYQEREREKAIFYDNSDEEAQDFDPDRAAADEALAESNTMFNSASLQPQQHPYPYQQPQPPQHHHHHQQQPARATTPVSGRVSALSQAHRSTSLGRVTGHGRPKSPVVRRPMSPAIVSRPFTPGSGGGAAGINGVGTVRLTDEELRNTHSLSRTSELTNGVSSGPKRSVSASRGRLGRTLSASAQGNNNNSNNNNNNNNNSNNSNNNINNNNSNNTSHNNNNISSSNSSNHLNSSGGGIGIGSGGGSNVRGAVQPGGGAGLVASNSTSDANGRRAFIRRMRSNETSRRIARSSSSTGVENRRGKGAATGGNGGVGGGLSVVTVATTKSTPSHISETMMGSEVGEMEDDSHVQVGPHTTHGSVNAKKENYIAIVDSVDKTDLMRLLGQRMQPIRLAALAHAALLSSKHRNDEEVLRNCCAYLHRLTVPSSTSSSGTGSSSTAASKSGGGGHEVSAKEQINIRKFLKARQGVEALLQALHPPEVRHPTTLCYGLLALGNLTAWDLEAHKQFRNAHGVVQVTQVMKVHIQNSGVQEKGCYALACVGAAYPTKSKNIFEQSGALDVVIGALSEVQGTKSNDAVTKQACAAIGSMCSLCPANAQYAGRKEALTYLVTSFDRFRKASKGDGGGKRSEMRLVCKAFIDLLCHAENRKVAGAKGGSTMIIRAMRIFRLEVDFVQKGLTTLAQFCSLKTNGAQIVQANGVDDIVAAMERFKMVTATQREGCKVLGSLIQATGDQARRRIVHAGGAEAIVFSLERFGAIPELNEDVVKEACRALDLLFLMENQAEREILGRRMRKIRCDKAIKATIMTHRNKADIQDVGKDAIKRLNALGGGGLWSRMRNGSKKCDCASQPSLRDPSKGAAGSPHL